MLELYKTNHTGLGTVVEVKVDKQKGIVTRQFKYDAITVSGKPTNRTKEEIDKFWNNEIYWIKQFENKSSYIIPTYDIDYVTRTITQPYMGPTLLDYKPRLQSVIPDIEEQILDMYRFFKDINVFKCNGSLSNLLLHEGKIVAFDFKWCEYRPNNIEMELKSYDIWLSKISKDLPKKLRDLL